MHITTDPKQTDVEHLPDEIVQRVKVIRERLERLHISGPGYRLGRSNRSVHVGREQDDEDGADSHAIHLVPRQ